VVEGCWIAVGWGNDRRDEAEGQGLFGGWNKQSAKIWGSSGGGNHDVTVLGEVRW
jgi:hypothetical protein